MDKLILPLLKTGGNINKTLALSNKTLPSININVKRFYLEYLLQNIDDPIMSI